VNKSQLVERLAANHFEGNKRAASHALEAVVDTVSRHVARDEKVAITGFGAFERQVRDARMVRNPRTGERKRAKKTAVPKFRAGAQFKAVVADPRKLPKLTASKSTSSAPSTATTKKAASKSTARKATASSPAKKSAAKTTSTGTRSTAKKSTAKKTAAKTTTAKRATARSTAKKTTAKTSAPRKSTAKKATS
jgi:DNA-binding protein HU-beta